MEAPSSAVPPSPGSAWPFAPCSHTSMGVHGSGMAGTAVLLISRAPAGCRTERVGAQTATLHSQPLLDPAGQGKKLGYRKQLLLFVFFSCFLFFFLPSFLFFPLPCHLAF